MAFLSPVSAGGEEQVGLSIRYQNNLALVHEL